MEESAKYLIHADVTASGVVEREDVVGAVYGQTEGLLGSEMDLRSLQEASKVGRIDVDVDSEGGRSFGELTIASSLDRVETAVLAASLETIGRVGPCRSEFRVTAIEDVRAAKRREIVDRAKELLEDSFDEHAASSREILEEVRRAVRVEDITEYEGLPAGPNVVDSDAIVVVEGRSDVLTLLQYGIKNAVAVEGTDVPDAVAALTQDRTVTAFLDGDRGGDLILKELAQVGDVDYVALAPPDRSVEDLDRGAVMAALREKIPYDQLQEGGVDGAAVPTDGGTVTSRPAGGTTSRTKAPDADGSADGASATEAGPGVGTQPGAGVEPGTGGESGTGNESGTGSESGAGTEPGNEPRPGEATEPPADGVTEPAADGVAESLAERQGGTDEGAGASRPADEGASTSGPADEAPAEADTATSDDTGDADGHQAAVDGAAAEPTDQAADQFPGTLPGHVEGVVEDGSGTVRMLDESYAVLDEAPADEAFDAIEEADTVPSAVVLDGTLTQRILDVAAQRGVGQVVARETGDLVKQPVGVRIRTADQLQ